MPKPIDVALAGLLEAVPRESDRAPEPRESDFSGRMAYLKAKAEWRQSPYLRAPATAEALEELRSEISPLEVPLEAKELYRLADGDYEGAVKPGYQFLPISACLRSRSVFRRSGADGYPAAIESFLPLFQVNRVLIGLFPASVERPLYGVNFWEQRLYRLFPSLTQFLEVLTTCHSQGVFAKGKPHQNDPSAYLKREREVVAMHIGEDWYPLTKKRGATMFNLLNSKYWPTDVR